MSKKSLVVPFLLLLLSLASIFNSSQAYAQTCPQLPANTGTVTATVSLASSGTYKIWSRVMVPDTSNNSYWLQVDSQCALNIGDSSSISPNSWKWIDYQKGDTANKAVLSLNAGTHTVKLIGREGNVKIDKLLFSTDLA